MSDTMRRLLLIEDDADTAEMLLEYLESSLPVRVTLATQASEALDIHRSDPHELALADIVLPDMDGLELCGRLKESAECEVILMSGQPTLGRAVEAIRVQAVDLLIKPFDLSHLSRVVAEALRRQQARTGEATRYRRLRDLSGRIVRERRELRQRVDLVCRDLVGAYRRLAEKVADFEGADSRGDGIAG